MPIHPFRRPRAIASLLGAALFTLALPDGAHAQSSEDRFASLVAAEQAFADDALRVGVTPAFRAHAASDSVLLAPEPVSAPEYLAGQNDAPGLTLEWRPSMAGVASSGDLGFTSGPYRMVQGDKIRTGQFLTIWSRGADGRWRWFLDHGLPPQAATATSLVAPAAVTRFAFAGPSESKSVAGHGLEAAEQKLNAGYLDSGLAALLPMLAADGYLLRPGRDAIAKVAALDLAPETRRFVRDERLGMRISASGDLAASYGRLIPGAGTPAYYVRVWRRNGGTWELLIDELV